MTHKVGQGTSEKLRKNFPSLLRSRLKYFAYLLCFIRIIGLRIWPTSATLSSNVRDLEGPEDLVHKSIGRCRSGKKIVFIYLLPGEQVRADLL